MAFGVVGLCRILSDGIGYSQVVSVGAGDVGLCRVVSHGVDWCRVRIYVIRALPQYRK